MIELSNLFLDSVIGSSQGESAEICDKRYQIHIGNMHIGMMDGRHLFLRVTQEERVLCDFHGICHVVDQKKELHVAIEPGDYDYFTHLKTDGYQHIWEGDAKELGHKLRRMVWAADMINEAPAPYELLRENCNLIAQTLLSVAELGVNQRPDGWTPGYNRKYDDIISLAKEKADRMEICTGQWFELFKARIEEHIELFGRNNLIGRIESAPGHLPK